jgi:D-arginine dehydrogenase
MTDFDVLIVGGGIAGASLGARIAGRARVAILEAEANCAVHSTGRSAAFWLAHYGGLNVIPLTIASWQPLEAGWPSGERSFLHRRGAIVIGRVYRHLWNAMSVETDRAPRRREIQRDGLERRIPGLREGWDFGLDDATCADIDVAGLHNGCLAAFRQAGGKLLTSSALTAAKRRADGWEIDAGSERLSASTIVNAAGAWADDVARRCGVPPIHIQPYRRTIVQLRVGRTGLKDLPLIIDGLGKFYFKGESDNRVWVSPHDETATDPCDVAPEEIDVAQAVDHFESVVDWPVEAVERKWAGLRSFTPARVPAYGYEADVPGFFWCVGQGGFGIQTAPAASAIAAALLLDEEPPEFVADVDSSIYAPRRFDLR